MNITVKEKRNKRWVTLKPCEMHLVEIGKCEYELYAGCWEITFSDTSTYTKFSKLAHNSIVFQLNNTNILLKENVVYSLDLFGINSRDWLLQIIKLLNTSEMYGINAQIELDKRFMDEYDLWLEVRDGGFVTKRAINDEIKDGLYNTYCSAIMKLDNVVNTNKIMCKQKNEIKDNKLFSKIWDYNGKLVITSNIQL